MVLLWRGTSLYRCVTIDTIGTVTLVLCVMWSVFHEMCSLFRTSPLTRGDGHRLHPLHYSADTGPLGGVFEDYTFHYKISWSRADGEWSLPVEVPLIPSYTITGLSPGSEYRVRVLAESEEDSTVVSGPVTVKAVTQSGVYVCT